MSKDEALSLEQTLRLALEALYNLSHYADTCELFLKETHPSKADALRQRVTKSVEAITAIKAALLSRSDGEAKDEPVGLIESLKDAKPCCGQYETCWRACTPRGKFIGQRDAQRKPLTDEEIQDALEAEFLGCDAKRNWQDDLRVARAIEAAHGIIDPTDLKGKHDA